MNAYGAQNETTMRVLERSLPSADTLAYYEGQRFWGEFLAYLRRCRIPANRRKKAR